VDTAGWGTDSDSLAAATQQQRANQQQRADLVLWCSASDMTSEKRAADEQRLATLRTQGIPQLRVWTKTDLIAPPSQTSDVQVSAVTGEGLDELRQTIAFQLAGAGPSGRHMLGSTAARCRETLTGAIDAVERAEQAGRSGLGDELIAIELREALDCLGHILGTVYTDDILDRIFSKFCIGK